MSRARILVVDDEPGMLRAIERVLGADHELVLTPSPSEALRLAKIHRPELALLDIRMPEMSGFDLLERMKAERADLDVIVMTGSVTDHDANLVRAIQAQAYYFIQKPFDREVLRTLVDRCVATRRLTAENRRHTQRMERELALARAFQLSLLPPFEAQIEGVDVAGRYVSSSELGGDFFDYAGAGVGAVGAVVADVSGHGVSAAMLTGVVKSAFHESRADGYAPLAVVERVFRAIRSFGYNRFITLLCLRASSSTGRVDYVNAGHPPGILLPAGSHTATLLESSGPLVSGGVPDTEWSVESVAWAKGDRLLLYTDGILEAEAEGVGGIFGLSGLIQQARSPLRGAALLDGIVAAVNEFSRGGAARDDLTLLSLSRD